MKNIHDLELIIKDNRIALLYISTANCNVCKALKPKIQAMCSKFNLLVDYYFDIDTLPELKSHLNVFSVPVIILFVDGKETLRYGRNIDLKEFESRIRRYSELLQA